MRTPPKPTHGIRRNTLSLVAAIVTTVLATVATYKIFQYFYDPHGELALIPTQMNYCMVYTFSFQHSGPVDSANFHLRLKSKLNGVKAGIPENGGKDAQNGLYADAADLDTNACFLMGGGSILNTTNVTASFAGNTVDESIGALPEQVPVSNTAIGPFNESNTQPAPQQNELIGDYTFSVFGITIHKPIKLVDHAPTVAK